MAGPDLLFAFLHLAMRETALFAAVGFLALGLSDLLVDGIWIGRAVRRRCALHPRARASVETLAAPRAPGRMAILIAAWDEAAVIGDMLRHTLATFDHPDYRLYVGCYPNDPAGIAAVRAVGDGRVRLVVGPRDGPTTKADCLNRIWRAMREEEEAEGWQAKAIVLHDAEDVVHPAELRVFERLIERFDLVQLPVLPLIDRNSRWIAGHYADEFAEAHGKELVVREAVGAALPSAGVGCAFSRRALARMAELGGGDPFDASSLTEDYELGLRLKAIGGRAAFVRLPADSGRPIVATQEFFPSTVAAAVRQKARWTRGIALSGWDRLGWSGGIAERWMRVRDRQSILAAIILLAGYAAFLLWTVLALRHLLNRSDPEPVSAGLALLLKINSALLLWRLAMRFGFVTRAYGWTEGLRSLPRAFVGNMIAILAAGWALLGYARAGKTAPRWDKTLHSFPAGLSAE